MRLDCGVALEFSSDSGAGGLMRIDEFSQQAGGVIEVRRRPSFQLFTVSRRSHEAELRAAGLQSMRGFGERLCVLRFWCGANLLHQDTGIV